MEPTQNLETSENLFSKENTSSPVTNQVALPRLPFALNKKIIAVIVAIVLLAAVFYFFKDLLVVAKVNGTFISRYTLISRLEQQYGEDLLDNLITETLIKQEAKKQNIEVTEAEMNERLDEIKASLAGQGQTLEEYLQFQGATEAELRENIELRLLLERLLVDKIAVTDEEIDAYIEENKDLLGEDTDTSSEEVRASIRQSLQDQKFNQEAQAWLELKKTEAIITQYKTF